MPPNFEFGDLLVSRTIWRGPADNQALVAAIQQLRNDIAPAAADRPESN